MHCRSVLLNLSMLLLSCATVHAQENTQKMPAEDVIDILAVKLLGLVPEDESVIVSTNRGLPVSLNDKSRAGTAFRNIARRLEGEKVPFMSLDDDSGFLQRLSRLMRASDRNK